MFFLVFATFVASQTSNCYHPCENQVYNADQSACQFDGFKAEGDACPFADSGVIFLHVVLLHIQRLDHFQRTL